MMMMVPQLDFEDGMDEDEEADEDPTDSDFYVSTRRGGASRARREAAVAVIDYPSLTREQRVQRYKEKRARRNFRKTIRYQSRKAYAEIRPRIKGRFVSPEEFAAYMAQRDAEAIVPAY